ncbi:site-specific DNA-methyltransferase [Larkinella insperata]|uniref:site-specific DNA-methyltransferase (adenine-specific) n=1 Tax=Larkinella insperata TaxID=332158 RepID=A0ABW3QAI4_9BACT|nr:site-specific DNA-methyltransferase [Larkinella insperata]
MQSEKFKQVTDKLPLASPDLTQELLRTLRDAAPQIFSENKVDFNKLRTALGDVVDESAERYGLTWAGKREAFRNVQSPSVGTLRPQFEASQNWDTTDNLILEGDNLEILKLLQKSYYGKVKLIYIDPPYNTGNEFIYPDNFREGLDDYLRYSKQQTETGTAVSTNRETNGRYHSAWLSMMYPRLFLARNLLRQDGMIFVSIDDHEIHNLRLLMDEIFGEENFLGCFIWHRRQNADNRNQDRVSTDHEYVLLYKRFQASLRGKEIDVTKYTNPDNDPRGAWFSADLTGLANKEQRPNLHYDVVNPKTGIIYKPSPTRGWSCSSSTFQDLINKDQILWPKSPDGRPRLKKFLKEVENFQTGFSTLLKVGFTTEGTKLLQDLFEEKVFPFPKPVSLIKTIIQQATESNDIILDFFAGSGTTAQAVIEANQEDNNSRRFILIQLPESTGYKKYPTIAHLTRERVKRVIRRVLKANESQLNFSPERIERLGFRALKLDSSNFKIWKPDNVNLTLSQQLAIFANNIEIGRTDEDLLYEIILKSGLPLETKVHSIMVSNNIAYSVQDGSVIICLGPRLSIEIFREIFSTTTSIERSTPKVIICLDNAFHGDDSLKTNSILEAQSHGITLKTV